MTGTLRTRTLTPEAVFREFALFCDDRHEIGDLTPETTIGTLRWQTTLADDLPGLGQHLAVELSDIWWKGWTNRHTVWDLCCDLAEQIEVPVIEPVKVLGRSCETAGAFLTLRHMLAAEGVDESRLAPSTPLGILAERHSTAFRRFRLAMAGRTPARVEGNRTFVIGGSMMALGSLGFVLTFVFNFFLHWRPLEIVTWVSAVLFLVGTIFARIGKIESDCFDRLVLPRTVTFRQLIHHYLGCEPRRPNAIAC